MFTAIQEYMKISPNNTLLLNAGDYFQVNTGTTQHYRGKHGLFFRKTLDTRVFYKFGVVEVVGGGVCRVF